MTPEHTPHPMEGWLRRYAQSRRQQAGAPFELSPADREALLAEARRVHAAQPAPRRPVLWAWWTAWSGPRWAMAAALFVTLGLAVFALWRTDRPVTGAPEKTLVLHKPPEGTVARTEPAPNVATAHVASPPSAEMQAAPTVAAKAADHAPTAAAPEGTPLTTRRATSPPAETERLAPQREAQNAILAAIPLDAHQAEATATPARRGTTDIAAVRTLPPSRGEAGPAQRSTPPPPPQEVLGAPPPAAALRGAPGAVGATYAARSAAPQAVAAPAPEVATAPPAPEAKPAQGLAEFYLAQQAASQDRVAMPLTDARRAFEAGRSTVPPAAPATPQATTPKPALARQAAPLAPSALPTAGNVPEAGRRYVLLSGAPQEQPPAIFYFWSSNQLVRVVDADGTVYEGRFLSTDAAPPPAASPARRQTSEKTGARELLTAPSRKTGGAPAAQDGAAQAPRRFEATGRHPHLQQEIRLSGDWPPDAEGVLRLQLRVGDGPVQTFLARPAEN
ncbi:MAG: hypothetical protein N3J91_06840 [Verrucomicrobiae bacterium]|nr:hypothetical protein [Verrucomicrobiae bacterium]